MTEITREQLQLAALAAGHDVSIGEIDGCPSALLKETAEPWRPHTDDGDAARLAVRLQMDVAFGHHITHKVYASRSTAFPSCHVSAAHDGTEPDKMRAWREAVVLCAAAVGERMQEGAR